MRPWLFEFAGEDDLVQLLCVLDDHLEAEPVGEGGEMLKHVCMLPRSLSGSPNGIHHPVAKTNNLHQDAELLRRHLDLHLRLTPSTPDIRRFA
jgi:hypothetical protein